MKRPIITLLLALLCSSSIIAQQLTEAQKAEAVNAVKNFCSLLSQFSNGGTQYLTNDKKIFALCSSPKIRTYDNISSHKEIMLNAYLALITRNYHNRLPMTFTAPVIEETYYMPKFEIGTAQYEGEGDIGYVVNPINHSGYSDIWIVLSSTQNINIPAKAITTKRNFIYSLNEHKILSFTDTRESPYSLTLKALNCYTQNDYNGAITYCDRALTFERFDKKMACAYIGGMSALMIEDISRGRSYLKYMGELSETYGNMLSYMEACQKEDFANIVAYAQKLSVDKNIPAANRGDLLAPIASTYYHGIIVEQDIDQAFQWYQKAINIGSPIAGYLLFCDVMTGNYKGDLPEEPDVREGLEISANRGYLPALSLLGLTYGALRNDLQWEEEWYKKAAEAGDPLGMVYYGCCLAASGKDRKTASYWMNKGLASPQLDAYEDRPIPAPGMRTRQEIQQVANDIASGRKVLSPSQRLKNAANGSASNSTTTTSPTSNATTPVVPTHPTTPTSTTSTGTTATHPSSTSSYTSSHTSSSYTPSSSSSSSSNYHYSYYKSSRPFNSPFDEKIAGLSAAYVQKHWKVTGDGISEKVGYWDDSKSISGLQVGFRIEPLFKYGFGIDTGIYYEYYYSKSQPMIYDEYDGYEEYRAILEEHVLYIPAHFEYRANIHKNFQIFAYAGFGFDFGLSAKLKTDNENLTFEDNNGYKDMDWKRVNVSFEYGGGIRLWAAQLNFTMADGLINMSQSDDHKVKLNKSLMCALSVMF